MRQWASGDGHGGTLEVGILEGIVQCMAHEKMTGVMVKVTEEVKEGY